MSGAGKQGQQYGGVGGMGGDSSGVGSTGTGTGGAISSAKGYTYSPSSTFQMAGNEQIQGKLERIDAVLSIFRGDWQEKS